MRPLTPIAAHSNIGSSTPSLLPTPFKSISGLCFKVSATDMTSDMSSNSTMMMGMMKPYLHFTPGDFLFFSNVQPTSTGGMAAACIVLFLLAFLERLVAAYGRVTEKKWNAEIANILHARQRPIIPQSMQSRSRLYPDEKKGGYDISSDDASSVKSVNAVKAPRVLPFVTKIEIKRGINRAVGGLFMYTLMLAVMTFNAAFILSIIVGLGIGEIAFGRFGFSPASSI